MKLLQKVDRQPGMAKTFREEESVQVFTSCFVPMRMAQKHILPSFYLLNKTSPLPFPKYYF